MHAIAFWYEQEMLLLNAVQWQIYIKLNTYQNYTLHSGTDKIFPLTKTKKVKIWWGWGGMCMWVYVVCVK
jgi:hypothetical protein